MHPDCVAAAESAAKLLESLGHSVEVAAPKGFDNDELIMQFGAVWAADCSYLLDDWGKKVGREVTADDVEILTWALAEMGKSVTAAQLVGAVTDAMKANRQAAMWWARTRRVRPPAHPDARRAAGAARDVRLHPEEPLSGFFRSAAFVPFTAQFNVSGQPAINLPLHWNDDGLPIGVQLVAAFGREDLLLRVAAQLETAQPWVDRRPPVFA